MNDHLHSFNNWRKQTVERRAPLFNNHHPRKKISRFRSFFRWTLILGLTGVLGGGIFVLAVFVWASKDLPDPNKIIEREIPLTTKIFARDEKTILYEIHGNEKRTMVELEDIPKHLINATLTAEDRDFYEHRGFSLTGIARSLIKNLRADIKAGGSTITQQLVKNAILSPEKTYRRKVKELILSYRIEKKFTKDEILKMYFNEIPYGSVLYGVEAAAQTFLGKSVKEITVGEAALLAAIPQAPSYYSPSGSHVDQLFKKQRQILNDMARLGYITEDEAKNASAEEIALQKPTENILAPHFVMYVKEYVSEKYGEKTVGEGGLKIITTLDYEKQKIAEEVIAERLEENKRWEATNASLVSLDPKTGQILAMVGSADYFNEEIDGQVNVALRPRQPGSSFKPVVYAAALKKGYTPETVVFDVNTKFTNYDGKPYEPKNYDLKEHGPVTFREALAGSLNVPAVKVIYLTGIDQVLDLADDLGYTTLRDRWRFGLSLVLGGGEVKLLEHTNAFAAFAREGEQHRIASILRVEDKNGNILEEYKDIKSKALDTQTARQITNILSDNNARSFIFGLQNYLVLKDRPAAAKTGTTNDYHDGWTIGFTPTLATGVWVGNANNDPMKRGADGSVVAAPIWNGYMSRALIGTPAENFNPPETVTSDNPALNGTLKAGIKIKIDKISGKLATEYTPLEFVEERTYQTLHSILFYVNKDDPRGAIPENPFSDPQFEPWENAVLDWGTRLNIVPQEPPKEYDDVHTGQNLPALTIFSPRQGDTISDRNINIDVVAAAPRGVQKVEYYIGGKLVGEKYSAPYNFSFFLDHNDILNGNTTVRVKASDDAGNSKQEFVDIILALPPITSGVSLLYPTDGKIITQDMFPLPLRVSLARPQNIETLNIFISYPNGSEKLLSSLRGAANEILEISWDEYPGAGIFGLMVQATNQDGYTYTTGKILVEVK